MNNKTKKIVLSALMAALTFLVTMIKVPSPTGYIHPGDGFVLLSGILLGPIYGGAAAGIGSMFADLLSGFPAFAPATFVIKALAAIIGCLIYTTLAVLPFKAGQKMIPIISAGIVTGFIVTSGYLIFEAYIMGLGLATALMEVPFNLVQNVFGIVVSTLLLPLLTKIPVVREFQDHTNKQCERKSHI